MTIKNIINTIIVILKELNDSIDNETFLNKNINKEYETAFKKIKESDKIDKLLTLVDELQLEECINTDLVIKDYEVSVNGIHFDFFKGKLNVKDFYLVNNIYEPIYKDDLTEIDDVKIVLKNKQKKLDDLRNGVKKLAKELKVDVNLIWEVLEE